MTEEDLKGYIPVYGDRVSTKAFCCMKTDQNSSLNRNTTKRRLLRDIYATMSSPKRMNCSSEHAARSNPKVGNKNAKNKRGELKLDGFCTTSVQKNTNNYEQQLAEE